MKAALLTTFVSLCYTAFSCSCFFEELNITYFNDYQVIISGEVCNVKPIVVDEETMLEAEIEVDLIYRNVNSLIRNKIVLIKTESDGAACGFTFIPGKDVLIFGYEDMSTNLCTHSTYIAEYDKQLKILNEIVKGQK